HFGDGSHVGATTVVWAAGVRAGELAGTLGSPLGPAGRVQVTPELRIPRRDDVFVVGDMASLGGYGDGVPYPMVAQVAMPQGGEAAKKLTAREAGRRESAFRYFDKGQMAIIGRRAAVVDGFGLKMRGALAWLTWLALHILYLRGFRNRLVVVLDWLAAFLSPTRSAGVIPRHDLRDPVRIVHSPPLPAPPAGA